MSIFLFVALVLVFTLNAYATLALYRSPLQGRRQKWPQLVLIWLLPVLGAILVIRLSKAHRSGGRLAGNYSADCGIGGGLGGYSAGDCAAGDGGGSGDCGGGGDGGGGGD